MAHHASSLGQEEVKITTHPPVHAFLRLPSFRLLKGQLWVLFGMWFREPARTAYSLHKGVMESKPDDMLEIDDGHGFALPNDIPLGQYCAASTK